MTKFLSSSLAKTIASPKWTRLLNATAIRSTATAAVEELAFASAKPFHQIPGFKALPFVGTSWLFYPIVGKYTHEQAHIYDKDKYELFGDISRDIFSGRHLISVYNERDIEAIVRNEGKFPNRGFVTSILKYRQERKEWYTSLGVILLQGKDWYDLRFKFQRHLMKPRSVDRYINPISDVSHDLIDRIIYMRDVNNEIDDTMNELFKWALESVAFVAIESRLGCLDVDDSSSEEGRRLIAAVQTSFDLMNKMEAITGSSLQLFKYINTPKWKKFTKAMDFFTETAFNHAKRAMDALREGEALSKEPSVLKDMLGSQDIKPHEIMTMVVDMCMAGIDSTSNTTGFLLYHLAKNPDKQETLYQEICRILPSPSDRLTAEKLTEMRYLKLCLKEAIRLHPVARGIGRFTERDLVLSGYQVPAGTVVLALLPVCGRLEKNFKNADKFIPERWMNRENKPSPYLYLPFGFGTRSCLGRRIAELEMWILATEIIRRFKVEYRHEDFKIMNRLVNAPDRPLKFAFVDRK